jgi:hypothetical protein
MSANRNWPMTVKGNTGRGVTFNSLLEENHRLQDQIKELRKTIADLVDELEREREHSIELEQRREPI